MSLHPSLAPLKGNKHRSVHKRFERIDEMRKQNKWQEGASSPFGLPKGKIIRVKITKKAKAAEEKTAAEGTVAAPAAAPAAPVKGKSEAK